MAVKKTAARPRIAKAPSTRQTPQRRTATRRILPLLRWLVRFAHPHTLAEGLALALVATALLAAFAEVSTAIARGRAPGAIPMWPGALLLAALASRLYPVWRTEIRHMTLDRARQYVGVALMAFVVLSIGGHSIATELGIGSSYLLLGPLSAGLRAAFSLGLLSLASAILLLRLPVHYWAAALMQRLGQILAATRDRATLETAVFEPVLLQPETAKAGELEGDEPVRTIFTKAAPLPRPVTAVVDVVPAKPRVPVQNGPSLPPIDIFVPAPKGQTAPLDTDYMSQRIQETLASFHVAARVVGHHVGPVVTQFDVQPDRGVKVKSITSLHNDLALALAAPTIRIQAPVPGKPVVGIEIPNTAAQMVTLRELLEDEKFSSIQSPLKVVLGKDVSGGPAVIDLAKMPHLLIAGATGSGKSVCVNALITCLLYANTPEQVRLMMIDPKMVELTVYNGVPHLLSPVVTEMDKVVGVLQWALREMERRYRLFAESTVRNIQRYNEKMESAGAARLPYIVLIIDELADLMMVSPDDVEDAICRLAQLARAAGIHLVIATQRPSVDVVTGLIKANFPARIAFQMSSQVDSRTILDSVGAEKLLGRGDMLYQPPDAPKPVRLQGAFLGDQEIEKLVEFWHRSPLTEAIQRISAEEFAEAEKDASAEGDELLADAVRTVREYQHASVSLLQRRLKIGYSRAARIMDQLEERGVVGPSEGGKQRQVLSNGEETDEPDDAFQL